MDQPSLTADGKTMVFRSRLGSVNPSALPFDPVTERVGTPRQLMTRTGTLNPGSVSPDNQWLVLANQGEIKEDLFVMRTDGTGLRRLTDDIARDRGPRWAPDGKSVLFYSNREGLYGIFSIRPDGSGLTRLVPSAKRDLYWPAISPADGTLLFNDDALATFLMRPPFTGGDSQVRNLKNVEVPDGVLQLSGWSPDGRYLSGPVLSKSSGAPIGVGIYDLTAEKSVKLTDDGGQWLVPFLPDGKRVIYITNDEVVIVDIATGRRRAVPVSLGTTINSESTTLAPDGRTIYYGAARVEANVWMVRGK